MFNCSLQRSTRGSLPTGWEMRTVASLGDVVTGTTPSTSHPEFYGGDIPFVTPVDLGDERYITSSQTTLTNRGGQQARLLPPGSILVTCIGILGKVGQAQTTLATNQQINSLIPGAEIDGSYAYWSMHLLEPQLEVEAGLQVVPIVNKSQFSRLVLPMPPLGEQRRIAEILDTADDGVRQTERLIAKLKAIKAGLLHDLFTRGLDERGRLRDPQAHPEQFKESPLGRIPMRWEVKTVAELGGRKRSTVQTGPFGAQLHSEDYVDEGVPFVLIRNLQESGLDTSDMPHITDGDAQRLSLYALEPGDIVFSRVGRVGSCFLAQEEQAGWVISGQLLRIRVPHGAMDHSYLLHALRSKQAQDEITGASVGTTRHSINTQILESLRLLVPPRPEQQRIGAALDAHDARIRAEEAELAKLRQVKRGLMDDLLTGRVRVPNA